MTHTDELLQPPIAYQAEYTRIAGSVCAGLMLSYALHWGERAKDADGWFCKTQKEMQSETGLSRHEQDSARKRLVSLGLIEEWRRGIPARMYYKVNKENVKHHLERVYHDQ